MGSVFRHWVLLSFVFVSVSAQAEYQKISGLKYPNSKFEGDQPNVSEAFAPKNISNLGGFNELLPYVTPSPHQEDAGTCLFMSLTGAAEWWLNKTNNITQFQSDGDFNLSPRWWANIADHPTYTRKVSDWYSDTILMYNEIGAVRNRDYRFTKGWYVEAGDVIRPAGSNENNKTYGARYNWIDQTSTVNAEKIQLPQFEREVLSKGPKNDPWLIGTAPLNIVDQVKEALKTAKSPVQVVYNHQGFWHSVIIYGFDDDASIGECPFIKSSLNHFEKDAARLISKSVQSENKEMFQIWSAKYKKYKEDLLKSLQRTNGCGTKGVFYVRDSIYTDPTGEIYRYDLTNSQSNKPYAKKIILREYDWLIHLSNHVTILKAVSAN